MTIIDLLEKLKKRHQQELEEFKQSQDAYQKLCDIGSLWGPWQSNGQSQRNSRIRPNWLNGYPVLDLVFGPEDTLKDGLIFLDEHIFSDANFVIETESFSEISGSHYFDGEYKGKRIKIELSMGKSASCQLVETGKMIPETRYVCNG